MRLVNSAIHQQLFRALIQLARYLELTSLAIRARRLNQSVYEFLNCLARK